MGRLEARVVTMVVAPEEPDKVVSITPKS